MRQIFDEVQKISKCGWFDKPLRSTFEIGTQIILLKIDGFLKGWILNITPLKSFKNVFLTDVVWIKKVFCEKSLCRFKSCLPNQHK